MTQRDFGREEVVSRSASMPVSSTISRKRERENAVSTAFSAPILLQRSAGNFAVAQLLEESVTPTRRSPVLDVVASGGGQPLDRHTREFMESRMDADFSDVRVHVDNAATESARAVNAHAYTVGADVVVQSTLYAPGTPSGDRLLAHELSHVIQQKAGAVTATPAPGGISLSDPSDAFERAADESADRVMNFQRPGAASIATRTAAAVQRALAPKEASEEDEEAADFMVQRSADARCTRVEDSTCSDEDWKTASGVVIEDFGTSRLSERRVTGRPERRELPTAPMALRSPLPRGLSDSSDAVHSEAIAQILGRALHGVAGPPSLNRNTVQRCGDIPCNCPDRKESNHAEALLPLPRGGFIDEAAVTVQRAQEDCCERTYPEAIPIRWPAPNWHPGIDDPGGLSSVFDIPEEPLLIKRGSGFYDDSKPEISRYDRIIGGPPFNLVRPNGWPIHHKVPAYLGGWGNDEGAAGEYDAEGRTVVAPNLVVMAPGSHMAWHQILMEQPLGPYPHQGPSGSNRDGDQFCVCDLMPFECGQREPVPVPIPAPAPSEDKDRRSAPITATPAMDWEAVKRQIRTTLEWAAAIVVIDLLGACFATGVCEVGALLGLVGAGATALVLAILRSSGAQVGADPEAA